MARIKKMFFNFILFGGRRNERATQELYTKCDWLRSTLIYGRTGNRQRLAVVGGGEAEKEGDGVFRPDRWFRVGTSASAETTAEHFGIDHSGIQRDGGHTGRNFLGESLREAFNSPLGRAVGSDFGRGRAAPTRAEIDDDAFLFLNHRRSEGVNEVKDAFDIHVDDWIELFGREFPKRSAAVDESSVVDEEIRSPDFGENGFGPGIHLRGVADIQRGKEFRLGDG